ncbi:agamous-like MADS-box protein AGL62 [Sesamum indicum]|uniref:Agamous-like MADS-box protein AGL62 n=1 Tax=Sesamum indicum TaxID=4182 RepID=A0A6I9TNK6_SESIN|nr:agamous-like MADS-box protein AGL62 [Sesamum indicum]
MTKMEKESNLQVTFSKRRVGLFKKASELCTLTGSEAAVVVFSPGNKAHSFGHPDVHTVANKLLAPNSSPGDVANRSNHVFQQGSTRNSENELKYLAEVERQIEAERARGEEIERMRKACEKEKWFPSADVIEGLSYQQLEHLKGAVVDFGKNLETQVGRRGVGPGGGEGFLFGAGASSEHAAVFQYNTVIPYDQGATRAGEEDMSQDFNAGYGPGHF